MADLQPPPGFDPGPLAPPPLPRGAQHPTSLALDVSGTCNLACRYCAEAATQPPRPPMPAATLEAAWRLLRPWIEAGVRTSIHLGSGEPLLALPLLQELAQRIESVANVGSARRPDLFLTTNGTLLSRPVRQWLAASGWRVKVSLDGPQPVHDRWRVAPGGQGTFAAVAEAVADLAARMPDRLSVTAVLCRDADPGAVFAAIADLGVRRIELVPVAQRDPYVRPTPRDVRAYRRFVRRHARRYLDELDGPAIPVLIRFEGCVVRAMGYTLARAACGAGRSYLGVAPDGGLYPCFRFVGLAAYCLGSLATGLDAGRVRAFQEGAGRAYERRPACAACWAAPLCGGPCFACAELLGPGDGQPLALRCAYARADAWAAADLVARLRQGAPERLLQFLPDVAVLEGIG
jgi:uncharacterized protein